MLFQRFEDDGLAHFSYAVGDAAAGEITIVDPRRDLDDYLAFARRRAVRITHILETHIHADYASGAAELARRTGAVLGLSGHDEGEKYEVAFDHQPLRDGDEIRVGAVRLRAVHTPGHTPEHIAFLAYDAGADVPSRFLTGDFLFIGSLGRPDLLGEEAKKGLAEALFESVHRALPGLPDELWIHPAHGSGSMCGGGMSKTPERRLGEERRENPFLDPALDRESFVRRLLETLPPYPDYYLRMKDRNAGGTGFDRPWPRPPALEPAEFRERADDGRTVVDARHPLAFAGGHVPGALGLGLGTDMSTWAGWVAPYDRPLLLVVDGRASLEPALTRLARVGLDRVDGCLIGMDAWLKAGLPFETVRQLPIDELAARGADLTVLDVRSHEEWEEVHIDGALHIPGQELQNRLDELPAEDDIAVLCSSGYRSIVAVSVLLRNGFRRVRNVPGGMDAWKAFRLTGPEERAMVGA